jgi:hypothetical protein
VGFIIKKGLAVETIARCELSKDFWLVVGFNKYPIEALIRKRGWV